MMINFIILLAIFAVVAIVMNQLIEKQKEAQQRNAASFNLSSVAGGWRAYFSKPAPSDLGKRFRAWGLQTFATQPALHAWLESLPDETIQLFAEHLAAFCADMEFDLNWLLDQQLQQHVEVEQSLAQIVTQYVDACHQAVLIQDEIEGVKAYLTFTANPYRPENQAFAQTLFDKLVEKKLTTIPANGFDKMLEQERQVYTVQAIRQAAQQEPMRFQQALVATVQPPSISPQTATQTASQSTDSNPTRVPFSLSSLWNRKESLPAQTPNSATATG